MKKLYIIIILVISSHSLYSVTYENLQVGFSLEYPENWNSTPIMEANKPICIFEAIRNGNNKVFFLLGAIPVVELPVDDSRLSNWTKEMASAFGCDLKNVKSSKIRSMPSGDWYSMVFKVNGNRIQSYIAVMNGYNYNITFLTDKTKDKEFDNEVEKILNSIKLSVPQNIKTVETYLENASKDSVTNIIIPQQFKLTKVMEKYQTAPYAYTLYQNLLKEHNADYVLVANEMDKQLFCLNVKLETESVDNESNSIISKFVGNKFKQDGIVYKEISVGAWGKSPDKVFLHKFRLIKENAATTHYIFYCVKKENTDIIKIQLASSLESEFEPYFFELILKNANR